MELLKEKEEEEEDDDLSKVLECCVCLETYQIDGSKRPVALICGHSTCGTCYPGLAFCPKCRQPVNKDAPYHTDMISLIAFKFCRPENTKELLEEKLKEIEEVSTKERESEINRIYCEAIESIEQCKQKLLKEKSEIEKEFDLIKRENDRLRKELDIMCVMNESLTKEQKSQLAEVTAAYQDCQDEVRRLVIVANNSSDDSLKNKIKKLYREREAYLEYVSEQDSYVSVLESIIGQKTFSPLNEPLVPSLRMRQLYTWSDRFKTYSGQSTMSMYDAIRFLINQCNELPKSANKLIYMNPELKAFCNKPGLYISQTELINILLSCCLGPKPN
ncbi:MAG: hypothetical protein Barrevirus24_6 [Barrevirus sp.]|uniref:RING-type domain-containing protein n=1 Tax=Barrevirus sp. TaxID=2487763 RepID=A0A3G4ZQS6_9VIRU|nr:MAG: hypothetical protein Barrevirus24_6 [Barrevirus sp.]